MTDTHWKSQSRRAPYLFVAPFVILFCVFMVYPLTRSLILSFYKTAGPKHQLFVGLGNYHYLLGHDPAFALAILNTLAFTLGFLILQIPLSLGLAILLNSNHIRGKNIFRFCFFSSYLVGPVFVALVFFQLFATHGLINQLLSTITRHEITVGWLSNPNLVLPSLLIASLWLSCGQAMIYFLAGLQAIDRDLYHAAQVDGAGHWYSFLHITLPGIRPVLGYVILIGTIGGFQLFELPYVLFQGPGPGHRALTIVMYLFSMGFNVGDLGFASAIGWLLALILLFLFTLQFKFFWKTQK
jgi:ABC-type sugar transport system permease subunit